MGVSPVDIGPFTEGINLVDPLTMLNKNELSWGGNWRIGVRGNLYKRPGSGLYGTAPAKINGDALVNLTLRYYKSDGTRKTISAAGGKLRVGTDATGAQTDISINGSGAAMHVSNLVDWMVYKNRLYLADGTNPQRYNGTDDIYAGHFVHAAPTLAIAAGGGLTTGKTYQYKVTSVVADMGEGTAGAVATILLSGGNTKINLSVIDVAPAKYEETTKKIYRTNGDGAVFYFLAEITTGTTVYADVIADTALGAQYVPAHAPYADVRYCIMGHDERAYWFGRAGANASLVDVSDVGFPDRIPDTSFFPINNNDGDILTGGGLTPGGIVFFKRNSCWLTRGFGSAPNNISPREKRGGGIGSTAPFSIVSTPIGLIFLSQRGEIYKFDGTNLDEIGRKIASEFKGLSEASTGRIVACYHDYRYIISYDYRNTNGYNWRTLEYDTIAQKWDGPFDNTVYYTPSYYSVWDSVLDKGELYWGEANAASGSYIYGRTENTLYDRGTKFLSIARTGRPPLGGLGEVKTTKAFAFGEITADASLSLTHIDVAGTRVGNVLNLTSLSTTTGSILGGPDVLGSVAGKFTLGGSITAQTYEGSLGNARARTPLYEISDGGTATIAKVNEIKLLAEALPLK